MKLVIRKNKYQIETFRSYLGKQNVSSNLERYSKNCNHSTVTLSQVDFLVQWIWGCKQSSIWKIFSFLSIIRTSTLTLQILSVAIPFFISARLISVCGGFTDKAWVFNKITFIKGFPLICSVIQFRPMSILLTTWNTLKKQFISIVSASIQSLILMRSLNILVISFGWFCRGNSQLINAFKSTHKFLIMNWL